MDTSLLVVFWGAMAVGIGNVVLFFFRRQSPWLVLTPWINLALGSAWFTLCRSYFAQPEVSLDVPIRIDLVLLPPLMLFAVFAGIWRLVSGQKANAEGKT
jgi:hypothetical protein